MVLVTVVLPLHDLLFWFPRVARASSLRIGRIRHQAYMESMGVEWALTAATALLWLYRDRSWDALGLGTPGGWGFWLGLGAALGFAVFASWQRLKLTRSARAEVREAVETQLRNIEPILPHTRPEMLHFSGVALTAGLCEEVLYRGFLIWYLALLVPFAAAVAVSALLFGMAHAYQGVRGVLQTGLVGLALGLLYVLTGSLWVPMAVHAFVDLNSGLLAYDFLRRDRPDFDWT